MRTWRMGVALLAVWLGPGLATRAQYLPNPAGPQPSEPMPCAPSGGPGAAPPAPKPLAPAVPGPLGPNLAPPGPPLDPFSLPNDGTGAFTCNPPLPEEAWYAHIGAMALQRQSPGAGGIAVFDSNMASILGLSKNQGDTGLPAPSRAVVAESFNQLSPNMAWGTRGTIGYLLGTEAIELTSFYIFQTSSHLDRTAPSGLDAFFHNAPNGFQGDNGLFLQADRVGTTLKTTVWNTELNYRVWSPALAGWEAIIGARYFDVKDGVQIFTDDDESRGPDPQNVAIYTARAHNHIIAPQFGLEYNWSYWRWLSLGFVAKGAWGVNFANTIVSLDRGDGFNGFNTHRNNTAFGQVYELGAFVDINPWDRVHFRGGYNAFWVTGIATGPDQVDFNLQNTAGNQNTNGSLLFHGPMIEVQFLF